MLIALLPRSLDTTKTPIWLTVSDICSEPAGAGLAVTLNTAWGAASPGSPSIRVVGGTAVMLRVGKSSSVTATAASRC